MGHYDDVIEERERRENEESQKRTGLTIGEWERLRYMKKAYKEYVEFMKRGDFLSEILLLEQKIKKK